VLLTTALPLIVGADALLGGADEITAVTADGADAELAALVAVTTTRTV
jgi:hypothetical protein